MGCQHWKVPSMPSSKTGTPGQLPRTWYPGGGAPGAGWSKLSLKESFYLSYRAGLGSQDGSSGVVGSGERSLEGLSPVSMALWFCLIIWRGCSFLGLRPWEKLLFPVTHLRLAAPREIVCVCVRVCVCACACSLRCGVVGPLHGLQLWLGLA